MADLHIRPIRPGDADRVASLLTSSWGSTIVVSRGVRQDAGRLPAFLAERHGEVVGLLTYAVHGDAMEVVTVDALDAPRFYQRRGMRIANVHCGALDLARALNPSIPAVGEHGIEVHDEIELECLL